MFKALFCCSLAVKVRIWQIAPITAGLPTQTVYAQGRSRKDQAYLAPIRAG